MNDRQELNSEIELLAAESIGAIRKFLQQPEQTSMDIAKARVATAALSAWSRHKATESARETNLLILARELAVDKAEFRRLMRAGMPNTPVMKALSSNGETAR